MYMRYIKPLKSETSSSSLDPFAIVVRTADEEPFFNVQYLGLSSLKSIHYGTVWAEGPPGRPICQLQTTNEMSSSISANEIIPINPIWNQYFDSNLAAVSKLKFDWKTMNDSIGDEECFKCHPECVGGCFGPLANHCSACKNYNDTSAWFDINHEYRVSALWGTYKGMVST